MSYGKYKSNKESIKVRNTRVKESSRVMNPCLLHHAMFQGSWDFIAILMHEKGLFLRENNLELSFQTQAYELQ